MSGLHWTWCLDRQIPSRTSAAEQIVDMLLKRLEQDAWDDRERFGVHLAVEEALVNAIVHGNREDPDKSVHVVLQTNPEVLRVEITDQGAGFDPDQVPDPTSEDRLAMPHGRGLMLMRSFMSKVEYQGRGNQLIMEKHRDSTA